MTALRLNDPSLAADFIEWQLLQEGRTEYSRGDLEPESSFSVAVDDDPDEPEVINPSPSRHSARVDDTFSQIAYRSKSLKGYALALENDVVRCAAPLEGSGSDLVYRFLLACSRSETSQALGDTFSELCKVALHRFLGERAKVWNIDARSKDRAVMGGTTPKVVTYLAPMIGARPKAVPVSQLAPGGDGGCDLVATIGFDDRAMGHVTFFAQCAASSSKDYWRNKVAEPQRFAHNYELSVPAQICMFIPYVYRSSDGTWLNEADCSGSVVFDRGRILSALDLNKEPLPAVLEAQLKASLKQALAKHAKRAGKATQKRSPKRAKKTSTRKVLSKR